MSEIENIIWDFDGVILNSMDVREYGFKEIFKRYPDEMVDKLIIFHKINGGLSRYVKIRYFFEEILKKSVVEDEVMELANEFSKLMKKELTNKKYLIKDTIDFIENNCNIYKFHIASGSDENELKYLCKELEIFEYFITINGSPTPKNKLVEKIITSNKYNKKNTCLIGDSINDYDAARINDILFLAFNNDELNKFNSIQPLF
jgi:HAD superfamily hydrolase (TIGR01549 family)